MPVETTSLRAEVSQSAAISIGRWLRFAMSLLVVSGIWLVGLPWLGGFAVVADHIENQERQGIDPSAMFYSELEILPPVVHRIERLQKTNRGDFWSW
jgi:hypothetical protein